MNNQPVIMVDGVRVGVSNEADDNIIDLIEILLEIDETKQISKLNETSISNNNGGRILL